MVEAIRYGEQPEVRTRSRTRSTTPSTAAGSMTCWKSVPLRTTPWTQAACNAYARTWCGHASANDWRSSSSKRKSHRCRRLFWEDCWSCPGDSSTQWAGGNRRARVRPPIRRNQPPALGKSSWRRSGVSGSTRRTGSSRSSGTTSKAACRTRASSASSKSRDGQRQPTITVTRNEILYSLNKPEDFFLGIVEFLDDGGASGPLCSRPFQREPDFGVTSVNYDFGELLARAERPS